MIGIYLITNSITNKNYIGKSTRLEKRWKEHIGQLNLNKHVNIDLQNDWNKFGEDIFSFKILEVCSKDIITKRENHWIDIFGAREHGYNYDNRKKTKSEWGRDRKKEILGNLMSLCSYYAKSNTIGLFDFEDMCGYLKIKYNKLYDLISKIENATFKKYNTYISYNYDASTEYISFCKWDEDSSDDVGIEHFNQKHIGVFIKSHLHKLII